MPDELLDVVNEHDEVVDQQLRSTVHHLGLLHRGAHVLLFTGEGNMLIQKRSADRAASPSLLDCSVSEHLRAGETYHKAALRGMQEELGVGGIAIQPLVTFQMVYGPNDHEISTLFKGTVEPTAVRFDPGEIEQVFYTSTRQILQDMQEQPSRYCAWFLEIMNWYADKPSRLTVLKGG